MVQLGHKKNMQKNIEDYKRSVIDAYVQKKATQHEFGSYWRMQMGMSESKKSETKINERQDPN